MSTQFVRSNHDKMIAGVCGGVARYLNIDPVIVRLVFLVSVFFAGVSPLLYVILWIVMPMEPTGPQSVHLIPDHPRPVEQWQYDPHTGEKIQR